jgi:hypothetical protein
MIGKRGVHWHLFHQSANQHHYRAASRAMYFQPCEERFRFRIVGGTNASRIIRTFPKENEHSPIRALVTRVTGMTLLLSLAPAMDWCLYDE